MRSGSAVLVRRFRAVKRAANACTDFVDTGTLPYSL